MQKKYSEICDYWTKNPCSGGNPTFPFHVWHNKWVLEIGCGGGVDADRFMNVEANYTGIDFTDEAVFRTNLKSAMRGGHPLKTKVKQMNAEKMEFPNEYFDLVYSWGVIHHTVHPEKIFDEAYRVLKPGGHICVMLYNKLSIRYIIDIMILRKIAWHLRYYRYNELRKSISHPTKEQWVSWNTDNLGCPLSRVYSKQECLDLLYKFDHIRTWTENWGWFRVLTGVKK